MKKLLKSWYAFWCRRGRHTLTTKKTRLGFQNRYSTVCQHCSHKEREWVTMASEREMFSEMFD
jgi:hypothetical protein